MVCRYCGKRVGDMLDHLDANEKCRLAHIKEVSISLKWQLNKLKKDENNGT